MTTVRELRAARDAAQSALTTAEADDTMTESELRRLRRDAREAHKAWLDAATEAAIGFTEARP